MSTIESGTRTWQTTQQSVRTSSRNYTRFATRDVGMSKLATGTMTFNQGAGTVTLAGALGAFSYNDDVLIESQGLNSGFYRVTTTGANTLGLWPSPQTETVVATIRAA